VSKRKQVLAETAAGSQLKALVRRAEQGDREALSELRPVLEASPALLRPYDIARTARRAWMEAMAGRDLLFLESLERQTAELRSTLAGPAPTPLESLLVERIIVCWLQVHYADTVYAQNMGKLSPQGNELQQRRQDRAQRRYLTAIKALAQVRRLLVPVVQVNIAERQVNVAGPRA
jgi:hypothetical protein